MGWDWRLRRQNTYWAIFQSTHPVWDGTFAVNPKDKAAIISIHPSRVGWDGLRSRGLLFSFYFNPPIPCGMGHKGVITMTKEILFQSTHPVWDGTPFRAHLPCRRQDFNPPIPCGMGLVNSTGFNYFRGISIHPSRVGWDSICRFKHSCDVYFNPPIPCGMGLVPNSLRTISRKFQSTHPVWDGTQICSSRRSQS